MADYSRQFKAEDRDKRCAVRGESGKLVRCPECNKYSECPHYLTRDEYGTATFSALATEGDDGEMHDYDGKSRREVADEMGLPKSTVIDKISKLKKITKQFLDDLAC